LEEEEVELASKKAFASLPDLSEAISNLTVLKGVGPATASAILAVYAPDIAPFMSDEVKSIYKDTYYIRTRSLCKTTIFFVFTFD
jgi:3-methyladenine DNA glycosylase/8-oxoguanine DNA glycosylase